VLSTIGYFFFVTGYALVGFFMVIERFLRSSSEAKKLERGTFDRGSTLLVGSVFGAGLILPMLMLFLGYGTFVLNYVIGSACLITMFFGLLLRIWAAKSLGRFYTKTLLTSDEQKIVDTGPYGMIRHPGYLGGILLWSGFGALSSNLILAILFPVMFFVSYVYRINVEETMLVESFGDEYSRYRKKTFRLIPFVW
jgi:protein-S-isoprenylcysteine O-methyltransferase Ste14